MSISASSDSPSRRFRLGALARLWPFMRPYRLRVVGAGVALVIAAGSVLAFGSFLGWLIDGGFAQGDEGRLDRILIGLLGVIVVMAGATYARAFLVAWIGERVACDLRRAVFDNLLRQPPAFYDQIRTGEVTTRLAGDTATLQTVVGSSASMALRNVLLMVGGIAMMTITSPRLTLMVLLVVPLVMGPILIFGRRVRGLSRQAQDRMGEAGAESDEALGGIRTIQSFNHEARSAARYASRIEASFLASTTRTHARAAMIAIVMVLAFGAIGFVLWQGGHDVIAGRIAAGDLAAFVFYAVVVAAGVGAVSEFAADMARASGASERLFELLDARSTIVSPIAPLPLPSPARGSVSLDLVTYFYPSRPDRPSLDDVSFDVPAGQVTALVGPSGAGKTTVFHLLQRFDDPRGGAIRFDGVDLRAVDIAALRARIAVVAQEPMIFADDVTANIRFGRPEANEAEIKRAAEAAQASEFIDRLPQGWATQLGERGVRLSGGQRQRIAIARALLRDPALLLLDEATSALDSESERLVQLGLGRLMAGRTVIVIAHRLATVLRAARIHVLDQGRLVESGTHGELAGAGGLYARLAELQFNDERRAAE